MATATCQTIAGAYSAAQPFKVRSFTCATKAGAETAAGNVAWAGSTAPRKRVNWLPSPTTPLSLDGGKTIAPVWYRALQELFENRLGGINGKTVPEIDSTAAAVQNQVLNVQNSAQAAVQTVNACVTAVNTAKQVAVNNNLAGATQIPTVTPTNPKLSMGDT